MTVHGGRKVVAELQKLGKKARGRNLDEATREGAKLVAEQAQVNVPVDTGRLRDSIFWRKNSRESTDQNSTYIVSYDAGRSRYDLTGAYYGAIVEWRTHYMSTAAIQMKDRAPEVMSKRIAVKMGIK